MFLFAASILEPGDFYAPLDEALILKVWIISFCLYACIRKSGDLITFFCHIECLFLLNTFVS